MSIRSYWTDRSVSSRYSRIIKVPELTVDDYGYWISIQELQYCGMIILDGSQHCGVHGGMTADTEHQSRIRSEATIDRSISGGVATEGHGVTTENRRNRNTDPRME